MKTVEKYVKDHLLELYELHRTLCLIPAPSNHEEKRAEFCKRWFDENCGEGAYVDDALNVVFPYCPNVGMKELAVIVAHTDTVFPDTVPMPYYDDGERIFSPGAGDDTASLAVMMLTAKYFVENVVKVNYGMLFVANSGEEGLGNLKGTRELLLDNGDKVKRFVSYDSVYPEISNRCVGSHRYEVEVLTKGGHSWVDFGEKNAIAILAGIANAIYSIRLPEKADKKVTFNVGTISGGTSVNTIAQRAHMLCEYRSDDEELLALMQAKFAEIFANAISDGVSVNVTLIGERPCMGDVDPKKQQALCDLAADVLEDVVGEKPVYCSSSTDCNVPLSLGIPAIAVGVYKGEGSHTREEWILKDSLRSGLELGIKTALAMSK